MKEITPEGLRKLSLEELGFLAEDIRQTILSTCFKNGGHLGASLGTVEIAIALHYVFDSPREPLIWDVGHQAYAHKLLTGRWESFHSLRRKGGISGFLSRKESPHDVFGAGHSSTALSAALAMAWARAAESDSIKKSWTVAIVGDGGLTAGLSFEALNNFKDTRLGPFLLVINDNQMSISKNSGAIASILSNREEACGFFELFGFDYLGPADGHDLAGLIGIFQGIRETSTDRPIVLHLITQKGKGYIPAEERPETFHGISPVKITIRHKDEKTENVSSNSGELRKKNYSEAFGEALCKLAENDSKIVAITAAMTEGTGLTRFARLFPERFFDVGIAEPHAVTFAAGLATQGYKPVVAIYSTFLQRCIDELIHDVSLQKLGVVFAVDRAGIVGADGPTHHGVFDLCYLGMIPRMNVSAPASIEDLESSLTKALNSGLPWAIRYPRGNGIEKLVGAISSSSKSEGMRILNDAEDCQLIVAALGPSIMRVTEAISNLSLEEKCKISVISVTQFKPLPNELISYCLNHQNAKILTVEDGIERGGFGQQLLRSCYGRQAAFEIAAYGDHFIEHGAPEELEELEHLSPSWLKERIQQLLCSL